MKCRLLFYTIIFLSSCKKEDATFQLPPNIISETRVFDIGNSGNASDIRVYYTLAQQMDITESRIIISKANNLTASNGYQLTADKFHSIPISAATLTERLPSTLKDSNGDAIIAGVQYYVYVLLVGKQNATQLSLPNPITLQDKSIYAGKYTGLWNTAIYTNFGVSVILKNDYTGELFYTINFTPCCGDNPDNGTVNLTFNGSVIDSFEYDEKLANYKGGCYATFLGNGMVDNDIFITINFTGKDCDGDHGNGKLTLTRLSD